MSSKKSAIPDISKRILSLSASYATDKAFLEACEISNHSFVTDLRKGRVTSPGPETLALIVRGTGCSGTWLLTGKGEMFPPEPRDNAKAAAAEPEEQYIAHFKQAMRLIENLEQRSDALTDIELPGDLPLKLSRLTTKLLEAQLEGNSD